MAKSCELVSQITTSPRISFQKTPYIYYTTLGIYLILSFKREHELHGVSRQRFVLTEVAGEGGTDCPPQKFLSSQKFRHLMG